MKARRVVHGDKYAHLAPPTYSEVMREAGDNEAIIEPTQPAAEHTASESSLPRELRAQVSYEARVAGVVEVEYSLDDTRDEFEERCYAAVFDLFPLGINVDDVEINA